MEETLKFLIAFCSTIVVFGSITMFLHERSMKKMYWEWIEGYREDVRFWKRLSMEYRNELEEIKRQYNIKNGDTGDELVEEL
jgi:hypothetical protein